MICKILRFLFAMTISLVGLTAGAQNLSDAIELEQAGAYERAAEIYRQLATNGDREAQRRLAELHDLGKGVKKDPAEAARWYTLAAEQGDPTTSQDVPSEELPELALLRRGHGLKAKEIVEKAFLDAKGEAEKTKALTRLLETCMFITDNACFSKFWLENWELLSKALKQAPQDTPKNRELLAAARDSFLSKSAYSLLIDPNEKYIEDHLSFALDGVAGATRFEYAPLKTALEARLAVYVGKRGLAKKLLRRSRALLLARNLGHFPQQLTLAQIAEISVLGLSDPKDMIR